MPGDLTDLCAKIIKSGRITAADSLAIRRIIYPDGEITLNEASCLFDLNDQLTEQDPAWTALFIEALTDYLVYQAEPRGYVSPENVDWLIKQITRDGEVRRETELALLVNVLEKAISAPDPLAVYALQQVQVQVLRANRIGEREVALMRRVLYAAGGQENIAITRHEAEVIYAIHDARLGEDDPAWIDLFSKALLNHLMFTSGYTPLTREDALRREAWLDDTRIDRGAFIRRMAGGLGDMLKAYREPDAMEEYAARREARQKAAEEVTDEEAQWLAERMLRDGHLSAAEQALIAALKAEQPRLHPVLEAALAKVS